MRLISCLFASRETLGVVARDRWLPVADVLANGSAAGPSTMVDLLVRGQPALVQLRERAPEARILAEGRAMEGLELLAPVPRPGKIVAIGRNYPEHALEEGATPPPAPLIFAKWPSSVVGPDTPITWDPELTAQVDYEAELAVVIGRTARHVPESVALDYVAGYTCLNDVSARDLQFGDGQWVRGKSLDTFCPMGPALVTADELPDPQDLAIRCRVGDEIVQDARTSDMFFGVAAIISHCSRSFTLEPGDVIATGTPGGVGVFRKPPRFLAHGDVVSVEIEGIGALRNACRTVAAVPA